MAAQARAETFRQEFDQQAAAILDGETESGLTVVCVEGGECVASADGNLRFQNTGSLLTLSWTEEGLILGALGFDAYRGIAIGKWARGEREGEPGLVGYNVRDEDISPIPEGFAPDEWALPGSYEDGCQQVVLGMLRRLATAKAESDALSNGARRTDVLNLMFKETDWPLHFDRTVAHAIRT